MDLSSIMNDSASAPASQKRTSSQASTPDGGRFMGQQQVPTPSANGIPIAGGYPPSHPDSQMSSYGPTPSANLTPGGLTPLKTPSQAHAGNQYPFPTQPLRQQSEPYPVGSPVSMRTNQQYPHMSPSHYGPGGQVPTLQAAHSTTSHSPPPSSHPSQTPHSIRQSPLATFSHPPGQTPTPQQQQQYHHASQPSTPLGPPPPMHHRTSNPIDRTTPLHQRTLSGASSGMITGSPAQHHLSIGNLVESPVAHHRPSSRGGRASDHHSNPDRERSVSVSPKTMVPPRLSSMGSRHSSQPDVHSARSSLQPSGSIALPGGTQTPPVRNSSSHSPGDVAHVYPQTSQPVDPSPQNGNDMSMPQRDNRSPVEYQSHRLGMNHLLSPSNPPDSSHHSPGSPVSSRGPAEKQKGADLRSPGQMSQPTGIALPRPQSHDMQKEHVKQESSRSPTNLKRPAEDQVGSEPPAKRFRKRKFQVRPTWAEVHPQAVRYNDQLPGSQSHKPHQHHQHQQHHQQPQHQHRVPARQQTSEPRERPAPQQQQQQQQQRRHTPQPPPENGDLNALVPWRQDPPLDIDLMLMRRVLGPWEKSMKWHTPLPSIVSTVQDWLFVELDRYRDVGDDPLEGAIEIEAKIGTLINQSDGNRCNLPVCSRTVIHPQANRNYRFESQMNMMEHRKMNEHLNALTRMSTEKGRVPIHYQHLRENDSFRTLSNAGINELPPAARSRPSGRELKLRTTTEDGSGNVKARIVKLPLGDLHIYSPQDPYDCRISINLEVNMNRPGIDPDALTVEPTHERPAPPDRHKDRMSYRHLAYTVDLTRVDVKGVAPKFELELELDASLLRSQMQKVRSHETHAYSHVVEGFLDNCALLMCHRG